MYLYEKEDGKVKVYEMKQDEDTLREYRKKEMEKIPKGKEVLYATTHYIDGDIPYLDRICCEQLAECSYFDIHGPNVYGRENSLLVSQNSEEQKDMLLNKFYDGKFKNSSILKLTYQICDSRYLLLTDKKTEKYVRHGIAKMNNIIEIPKSLYLLQMLENKNFEKIKNEDLSELLKLYEISYVNQIYFDELLKAEKYGICLDGFCDRIQDVVKLDEVIVKKIKPFI